MHVHLVLPGLLWPRQALSDTAHDLPLPGLSWLLGRGRMTWRAPKPLEDWLCRDFGGTAGTPAAALRLLGEGIDPGDNIWLCVDLVHLQFEQGRPSLSSAELGITREEMAQMEAVLAPLFEEIGEFRSGAPGCGYLKLKTLPQLHTLPPSAAIGRSLPLPSGPDAAQWLRLGNEAQMLLHALPLNAAREAARRATLNSLWFWGAGALPRRNANPSIRHNQVVGRQALLSGLAAWHGIAHNHTQDCAALLRQRQPTLLLVNELLQPTQRLDALAWREALLEIEQNWLQPLQFALRKGSIGSLHLTALGDETILDLRLNRGDAFKFWRRPLPLHCLETPS